MFVTELLNRFSGRFADLAGFARITEKGEFVQDAWCYQSVRIGQAPVNGGESVQDVFHSFNQVQQDIGISGQA